MITYSTEVTVNRSTATASKKEILNFVEAVQGYEEFFAGFTLAGYEDSLNVGLNGLTTVKALVIDAKPSGGVDNVDLLVTVTNTVPAAAAGKPLTPSDPQSFRCGSRLVLLDTSITALRLSNLSPVQCDIAIYGLGE